MPKCQTLTNDSTIFWDALGTASPEVVALLANYLYRSPRPLTLSKLLSFGRPLSPDSIMSSASYALSEIPRRLTRRIRALESLPFIVGTNPYVTRTLEAHRKSFEWLATYPAVGSLEENAEFATQLEFLVQSHANDIPTLAKGFQECGRYMSPGAVSDFLDSTIRNRIAVRLIAEQHIALTWALGRSLHYSIHDGVVNMTCSPVEMIKACSLFVGEMCEATFGVHPNVVIDGHLDTTFAYVPVHLQYILTELLKNAFRATVESHWKAFGMSSLREMPSVIATISSPQSTAGSKNSSYLSIRVRDEGGGVSLKNMSHIFSYAFTTAGRNLHQEDETDGGPYAAQHVGGSAAIGGGTKGEAGEADLFGEITGKGIETGVGTLAGLGYGLPMSRLYARYFGGSLDLFSLDGWGTDVILKLRCLEGADEVEI
ncbi:hypothetical protein EW145_g6061 [Phellinidium pouzarii]|uniref:Protein-serine/threonine kinase n=1 Tax=Phellinidium pouzarii TaxID=167371 RepID=A0A4S4KXV0_9AGAM|nr:hypothetical protein EW145_g6061 [Phellinidium pouzarii]